MMNFQGEKPWWFFRERKINYWWMFSRLRLLSVFFFFFSLFRLLKSKTWSHVVTHSQLAHIKSLQALLLKGQSISQTYQRESPHVLTTSTPPDTLALLSSHPGLSHFPLTLWPLREGEGGFPVDSKGRNTPKIKDITHHPAAEYKIKQLHKCILAGFFLPHILPALTCMPLCHMVCCQLRSHRTIFLRVNAAWNHSNVLAGHADIRTNGLFVRLNMCTHIRKY